MNSAKARFCQTPDAEAFRALAASLAFERGADAATIQFVNTLGTAMTMEQAAANAFKTEGAKQFLKILTDIGRPDAVEPREPIGQLKGVK